MRLGPFEKVKKQKQYSFFSELDRERLERMPEEV